MCQFFLADLCPLSIWPPGHKQGTQRCCFLPHARRDFFLLTRLAGTKNYFMKALAAILVAAAVVYAIFHYYFQKMPTTDEGTAPTQAISLTGVRMDLLQIAEAERAYIALNSRCGQPDELASSSDLPVPRTGRDGYTYSVECSRAQFTVSARHQPAPAGSPIRYPNLAVDENMQVSEIN
jgi:hypothetical protein